MNKSYFICLEGIDCSGKTTTAENVIKILNEKGIDAIQLYKKQTQYPSEYLMRHMTSLKELLWGTKTNDPIREITDMGWLLLHAHWYTIMASNIIMPNLKIHQIVLIDCWFYKILARFLIKPNFDHEFAYKVFSYLPQGDCIFMLDVDPEICYNRREKFTASELGESEGLTGDEKSRFIKYQSKVREKYLYLSNKLCWNVIHEDNKSPNEISLLIVKRIEELLKEN